MTNKHLVLIGNSNKPMGVIKGWQPSPPGLIENFLDIDLTCWNN